jgi:hypothetical protein
MVDFLVLLVKANGKLSIKTKSKKWGDLSNEFVGPILLQI